MRSCAVATVQANGTRERVAGMVLVRHLEDGVAAPAPAAIAHTDELPDHRADRPAGHPRQIRTIPRSRNFR